MTTLLQWLGLAPNEEEMDVLKKLNKHGKASMRVIGRGTLTMSARDARDTPKARKFIKDMEDIIAPH